MLTNRQLAALRCIENAIDSGGVPPALIDIAAELWVCTSTARNCLLALERKGVIRRSRGCRNVQVLRRSRDLFRFIPLP